MSAKLAVPSTADDLKETLLDKGKLKTLMDEGSFPEFMTNYVKEFGKANLDVEDYVKEQIDTAIANFARENAVELRKNGRKGKVTAADVRANKALRQTGGRYSHLAAGAPLDGEFTDFWDYLETVHKDKDPRDPAIRERRAKIEAAMSSTDPASGGFLIPEEFRATLMQVALESAVVRPRAQVIPMQSLRVSIPTVDTTSNVSSVYGGVIGYWTEEGAALTQSQPTFGRVVLEAKKLTAYTEVPNELRRDSAISVDAYIDGAFPKAVAWFEDIAFMFGSGAGEPLGVFNPQNNAIVSVAAESGQASATILWENLVNMYARMLPSSLGSAVWVVSPACIPQLLTTALSVGTGGAPIGMAMVQGGDAPTLSILGRPVIISEKVSNLGTAGDVNFVDFGQYLLGDRMAMEAEISTDYKFGNDMSAYRFIERVDGRPWLQSAITPRNSGPTLSPYLQLAAR